MLTLTWSPKKSDFLRENDEVRFSVFNLTATSKQIFRCTIGREFIVALVQVTFSKSNPHWFSSSAVLLQMDFGLTKEGFSSCWRDWAIEDKLRLRTPWMSIMDAVVYLKVTYKIQWKLEKRTVNANKFWSTISIRN